MIYQLIKRFATAFRGLSSRPSRPDEKSMYEKALSMTHRYVAPQDGSRFQYQKALEIYSLRFKKTDKVVCGCSARFRTVEARQAHIDSKQCPHNGKRLTRKQKAALFGDTYKKAKQQKEDSYKRKADGEQPDGDGGQSDGDGEQSDAEEEG